MVEPATHGLKRPLHPLVQREVDAVQALIDKTFAKDKRVTVLEAGCGSLTRVHFGPESHVVGIDISQEQLDRHPTLDARILGDIQEYPLEPKSYDAIVCWYVFEHLPRPDKALINFARAVKPGGLVIIAVPNILAASTMLAKITPHWFHVWVYKHVFGSKTAGQPGRAPFPTTLPFSIHPKKLADLAGEHGLEVVDRRSWEDPKQLRLRQKTHFTGKPWTLFRDVVRRASGGRIDPEMTEFLLIFRPI